MHVPTYVVINVSLQSVGDRPHAADPGCVGLLPVATATAAYFLLKPLLCEASEADVVADIWRRSATACWYQLDL